MAGRIAGAEEEHLMCGRFAQTTAAEDLVRLYKLVMGLDLRPRYNLAPTDDVIVIRKSVRGRIAEHFRWGLVPPWAKDMKLSARMINARSETIFEKSSFKNPVRYQRCMIPASGFYEWQTTPTGKSPLLFTDPNDAPLALAAIWSKWHSPQGAEVYTTAILTTQASPDLASIHHRMPVILDDAQLNQWLDPEVNSKAQLQTILRPASENRLHIRPVSRHVNKVGNTGVECWKPAE